MEKIAASLLLCFQQKRKLKVGLTAMDLLTIKEMPLDMSTYDHALKEGLFTPKNIKEKSKEYIDSFSSRLWHGHYGEDWE